MLDVVAIVKGLRHARHGLHARAGLLEGTRLLRGSAGHCLAGGADHERPLRALVEACEVLARDPGQHAQLASAVAAATDELERHFAAHLRQEEEVIFPAVRRFLDAGADAEIVKEMRARRRGGDVLASTERR